MNPAPRAAPSHDTLRTAPPASPPPASPTQIKAPGALRMLMEARAPWELAALVASRPWHGRVPPGDGHPVIVFPGLAAPDLSTLPLRRFLRRVGYAPQPWAQGFNRGPRAGVLERMHEQLRSLHEREGRRVSLVGWSLGGLYAREVAKAMPELVRCVVTLGSPFSGHPRATNAWRLFELVSGRSADDDELLAGLRVAPPVPTSSIFSRSDGIVAWQCSLNEDAPHTENIEVRASHLGMGLNPMVLYAVADRLAQDPQRWQRFDLRGARRWLYRHADGMRCGPG